MNECRECGSRRVIKDAHAVDRGESNMDNGFQVAVHENPDARIFKGATYSETRADVCADCGYVSIYATDPLMLWVAYQKKRLNAEQ